MTIKKQDMQVGMEVSTTGADSDLRMQRHGRETIFSRLRTRGCGLVVLIVAFVALATTTVTLGTLATEDPAPASAPHQHTSLAGIGAASLYATAVRPVGGFGTCPLQPSVVSAPLRWASDPTTADRICCNNHRWAEYSGYWLRTTFPRTLPAGETIDFYDVSSGVPLFRAPVGRSYQEFIAESTHHGWPSALRRRTRPLHPSALCDPLSPHDPLIAPRFACAPRHRLS